MSLKGIWCEEPDVEDLKFISFKYMYMIMIFDQDIVEQVYHEMGIGSVMEIHGFYQSRIINHHATMQQTCGQLMAEYEKLKQPIMVKQMDTVPVIRWLFSSVFPFTERENSAINTFISRKTLSDGDFWWRNWNWNILSTQIFWQFIGSYIN